MRNVLSRLNRQQYAALFHHYASISTGLHYIGVSKSSQFRRGRGSETQRWRMDMVPIDLWLQHHFSTGFTSIHGERPSAEYAKLRKESLENEFGHALGTYSSKSLSSSFKFGPFWALYRAAFISFQVVKLTVLHFFVRDIHDRAVKFRETLIRLGPFYIKLGQALSTRPDILPNAYCQELAKLQDQIPPFPTHVAIKSIETQLGAPVSQIFADISPEPIAAASLGQVYKAHLHSGELVAVKVQRPGMSHTLTLDALLFHMIGGQLKRFAKARRDLFVAVNEMVRHMFKEIDYILEAQNAERFAALYACYPKSGENSYRDTSTKGTKMRTYIKVPKIYWNYTRKAVLTMEWIDGIKLTDADRMKKAFLDRKKLINQGLYCSLRQLLEEGFFHADPHPGNLVACTDGSLAYFDFGMMGDIPRHYRVGLIQVLVHFVNHDSLGLANDFLSLGFIPEGVEIQAVADTLQASFGDGTKESQDFQAIMDQLYNVMYDFNFTLPPDYALVIRALGSLEGTAKVLDPEFKVVESAYPFIVARLLADPNPDMRKILRELLIRNNGSIRWNRLERLVMAISEQASESDGDGNDAPVRAWKSFDMHSVVAATEDVFDFILSEKGSRVRVFLARDIVKAVDAFIEDEAFSSLFAEKREGKTASEHSQGHKMTVRMVSGVRAFLRAVNSAPGAWIPFIVRMAFEPHAQTFFLHLVASVSTSSCHKVQEAFWLCISRLLHMLDEQCRASDS
ncbi:uncharacterized protein LOC18435640 isoform X1 [Amborella trichopoda]|uniref:Protein kinase domain-containing protein n=1 Tax=Amborella trichopoda TaxID=13333 RepID=W1PIG5_AMBTC|nr:uncharacterized protein LOC18435640 isoform X1 [Amborella trichopoda]XP_020523757.1 uncharacterized protein LOC18435640 isoform X1 [Amborella trichopoda]ERN07421.1 hypothetical protein AMTR_s00019p00246780 [Amborella trichopoda]|eukprot:XP_020523756.1 uncharacterized protein LOC18435640 isoform X1 [Amborella trichopoda]